MANIDGIESIAAPVQHEIPIIALIIKKMKYTMKIVITIKILVIYLIGCNVRSGLQLIKYKMAIMFCDRMLMELNIRIAVLILIKNCFPLCDATSRIVINFIFLSDSFDNILDGGIAFDNAINIVIKIEILMTTHVYLLEGFFYSKKRLVFVSTHKYTLKHIFSFLIFQSSFRDITFK